MSRTRKDRPYRVRCNDPREARRWRPGYTTWFGEYREGAWEILRTGSEYSLCRCCDWCLNSKTRWKFGRVRKPRLSRSAAKQELKKGIW